MLNKRITQQGYVEIGRKLEHVVVAERALGKPLPRGAKVHHANEVKTDNRPENLVICPNQKYHALLHRRMRAKAATGDPNKIKCPYCREYDDPENLYINPSSGEGRHRACFNQYQNQRNAR